MSEEPYAPDLIKFLKDNGIRHLHYKIEGNKVCFNIYKRRRRKKKPVDL
jgi:hypothetical protein